MLVEFSLVRSIFGEALNNSRLLEPRTPGVSAGKAQPQRAPLGQPLRGDNALAAAPSTSQINLPLDGRTFCDGRPAALFSRTWCRIGALSAPLARNSTQAAAFRTGKVNVMRWVLNLGTQLATTRWRVSFNAEV